MSELRWNPLLGEWVITATHRQDRTFFPPPDYNPLAPTAPGGFPTEIPAPDYEIVVFENKFPSLQPHPPEPAEPGTSLTPVRPAAGVCEVVCYTPRADATLADLPASKVRELVEVWTDRYAELGARPEVEYVYIFENKGREIGVTLSHPHGQIYAYPYVPPVALRELAMARAHYEAAHTDLLGDILAEELRDGRRIVAENAAFVAYVPFFARYPYEVHIVPREPRAALTEFDAGERAAFAEMLRLVIRKYDGLWGRSMPYIMAMHQRPTDGGAYAWYRFHVEFYPPYRTPEKLKYLAGSEAGAGAYINDTLAEETAALLRAAPPVG